MTDLKTIRILAPRALNPATLEALRSTFDLVEAKNEPVATLSDEDRTSIRGAAVAGQFLEADMDALPKLEIIAHFGVGYDGVDAEAAARRGVVVTNTPDVLTEEVADTALGLLLNTVREFAKAEAHLRAGRWTNDAYPLTRTTLRGRSVGIMGLGRIGLAIARRLEAFGLPISYYNRSRRNDVSYAYHSSLAELAAAVDTLIVAAPGGAETRGAVDGSVLRALGPNGVFINIGRGSVVDEAALIAALKDGTIAAAGLDVFESEPHVPDELMALPNAVLLPHVASASHATRGAMGQLVVDNLSRWFLGHPPLTPVPESQAAGIQNPNS